MTTRIAFSNFDKLTTYNFIGAVQTIIERMTDNPDVPAPVPTLASVQTLLGELVVLAEKAKFGDRVQIELRDEKRDTVMANITLLGLYAQEACAGNKGKLENCGFPTVKERQPVVLTQPQNMKVKPSGIAGEIDVTFKRSKGGYTYMLQITYDNPLETQAVWTDVQITTRVRTRITGLDSLRRVWVRAIAYGSSGASAPSDPAMCIVD